MELLISRFLIELLQDSGTFWNIKEDVIQSFGMFVFVLLFFQSLKFCERFQINIWSLLKKSFVENSSLKTLHHCKTVSLLNNWTNRRKHLKRTQVHFVNKNFSLKITIFCELSANLIAQYDSWDDKLHSGMLFYSRNVSDFKKFKQIWLFIECTCDLFKCWRRNV